MFGGLERHALGLELPDDVLKVGQRSGEAVDPGDDERVALMQEVEQQAKLGSTIDRGAALFLRADDPTAGLTERDLLKSEVLVGGGYSGVTVERHGRKPVSFGSRPAPDSVS